MHDYIAAVGGPVRLISTLFRRNATQSTSNIDLLRMIALLDHHLQTEKNYVPTGFVDFDIVEFKSSEKFCKQRPNGPH